MSIHEWFSFLRAFQDNQYSASHLQEASWDQCIKGVRLEDSHHNTKDCPFSCICGICLDDHPLRSLPLTTLHLPHHSCQQFTPQKITYDWRSFFQTCEFLVVIAKPWEGDLSTSWQPSHERIPQPMLTLTHPNHPHFRSIVCNLARLYLSLWAWLPASFVELSSAVLTRWPERWPERWVASAFWSGCRSVFGGTLHLLSQEFWLIQPTPIYYYRQPPRTHTRAMPTWVTY